MQRRSEAHNKTGTRDYCDIVQLMAILKESRALSEGSPKRADRTQFTPYKKGPDLQDSIAKSGLTNELHRMGRNRRRGSARTNSSLGVVAI